MPQFCLGRQPNQCCQHAWRKQTRSLGPMGQTNRRRQGEGPGRKGAEYLSSKRPPPTNHKKKLGCVALNYMNIIYKKAYKCDFLNVQFLKNMDFAKKNGEHGLSKRLFFMFRSLDIRFDDDDLNKQCQYSQKFVWRYV